MAIAAASERALSDELARDPSSLVVVQLADALRRRGQLDLAERIAGLGMDRHAHHPDMHDLAARIAADRGDLDRAAQCWEMALRLAPAHVGARKGLGFVRFTQGDLAEAERLLDGVAREGGNDVATALEITRRRRAATMTLEVNDATPGANNIVAAATMVETMVAVSAPDGRASVIAPVGNAARRLFADLLDGADQTALLLDGGGLVVAGAFLTDDDRDVAQEIGAELCGVRDEAERAMRYLELGAWTSLVFETDVATVAMAPVASDDVVLVAAARTVPLGLVRRVLKRCGDRAGHWLRGGA